ncbi:hypothetical protein HLH26_09000 [Gluconacetobacter sp. 1b LMG 1731]|uniref:Uncharacterized protein n=1 Tax=Gluconacetobacter dulcium TaxID=2729096 RepID=A0A7W4IKQ9_9PROT|nr:hypothetical protein [Gluconacetobacter dulcium]MBB2164678.1 hypothetical protein [Gluconacetobacter dulcium]MBB2193814.1 hypothetical protein [Gluconacetobacter dulcium]
MTKSSKPVFVNAKELEARIQHSGYSRDRQNLEARRLLNGNYLTVALSRELAEYTQTFRVGRRYVVYVARLVETTDGNFRRKSGRNVIKIHCEYNVSREYDGASEYLVEHLESVIDEMLELDKNRLSNGNYLTIHGNDCAIFVVETTDGAFDGRDKMNFVKIHRRAEKFGISAQRHRAPQASFDCLIEQGDLKQLAAAGYIPLEVISDEPSGLSATDIARRMHAKIIADDARTALASITKTRKRKTA